MQVSLKSSFSYFLLLSFLVGFVDLSAQQKSNDFTKRAVFQKGKVIVGSKRNFIVHPKDSIFSKIIKVEDLPKKYSSFGSKRLALNGQVRWAEKRVRTDKILLESKNSNNIAKENSIAAYEGLNSDLAFDSTSRSLPKQYYSQIDKRVDEWLSKVNNLSMQDINRFQFRKGRSTKPGFPVQRAGGLPILSSVSERGDSTISQTMADKKDRQRKSQYWIGSGNFGTSDPVKSEEKSIRPKVKIPNQRNLRSVTRSKIGNRKITVEVSVE